MSLDTIKGRSLSRLSILPQNNPNPVYSRSDYGSNPDNRIGNVTNIQRSSTDWQEIIERKR